MSRIASLISAVGLLVTLPVFCQAQDKAAGVKCEAFNGAVLLKNAAGAWTTAKLGEQIEPGALIISLPKAVFLSNNGAVEMGLLADIGQRGPFPVLESAVVVNKNADVDLDVRFDRGIVVFLNRKESGAATVAVHLSDHTWNLVLKKPKTRVGLEIYSRHMPGLPKISDGKVEAPVTHVVLLVLEGEVFLDTHENDFALQAPPGPARIRWDTVSKTAAVDRLEQLPEGITKALTKEEEQMFSDICACAGKLKEREAGPLLDLFLASDTKVDRLVGVTCAGAIDDLPRLMSSLANPKHTDVRRHAVIVLRHWMGREPGQVEKLYKFLKESAKYSDVSARTTLQLLFGFSAQDRFDPVTYDLLTVYLEHADLPIRELAHWHLVRLMSEGKNIDYDAAAPAPQRQQAVQQWRELIAKTIK